MPGLGTSFGRGGATTAPSDLVNSDAILRAGSDILFLGGCVFIEIQLGDIMAHVVVRVGDNLIESAIAPTNSSLRKAIRSPLLSKPPK